MMSLTLNCNFQGSYPNGTVDKINKHEEILRWYVVVVMWSACLPSTSTIQVRIPLTHKVFLYYLCLQSTKINKRGRGWLIFPFFRVKFFTESEHLNNFRGVILEQQKDNSKHISLSKARSFICDQVNDSLYSFFVKKDQSIVFLGSMPLNLLLNGVLKRFGR